MNGQIDPDARKVNTTPAIAKEKAVDIVLADSRAKNSTVEHIKESELMITRQKDGCHLAWVVYLLRMDSVVLGDKYFIDAHTGEFLGIENQIRY